MATIRKRGDKWQAQVFKKGIRKSGTFSSKAKAVAWANRTEIEIDDGKHKKDSGHTFGDVLEKYRDEVTPKKRASYAEKSKLKGLIASELADIPLNKLSTPVLAKWRDNRAKQVQPGTVNRELSIISSVLTQCRKEWKLIDHNPMADVAKMPGVKSRDRLYTDAEIARITEYLASQDEQIHDIFILAIETGMRRNEILGLTWDYINLDRRFLTLPLTKNGSSRDVPLSGKAIEVLRRREQNIKPFDMPSYTLTQHYLKYLKQLGIVGATFHDTRHYSITKLSEKLNILELARAIGHKDLKSLQVYYNKSASDIALKL